MSGFNRGTQPASLNRAAVRQFVAAMVRDELPDPFHIAHDCTNPSGHFAIASCGDVVCVHCSKVFWQ